MDENTGTETELQEPIEEQPPAPAVDPKPAPKLKPSSKPAAPKPEHPTCAGCGKKGALTEHVKVGSTELRFHGCDEARELFTGWFRGLTKNPDAAPPTFTK